MLTNKNVWFVLILFTLIGSYIAGAMIPENIMILMVLFLFGIKFVLISLQFMDLKSAHPLYMISLAVLLIFFITFTTVALI